MRLILCWLWQRRPRMPMFPLAEANYRQCGVDRVNQRAERFVVTRQRLVTREAFVRELIRWDNHLSLIAPAKRQKADCPQNEQSIQGAERLVAIADCYPQHPLPGMRSPAKVSPLATILRHPF